MLSIFLDFGIMSLLCLLSYVSSAFCLCDLVIESIGRQSKYLGFSL
jgi:hypothetical protein